MRLHMQGALTGIHGRPRIAARLQCKVSTPGQGWLDVDLTTGRGTHTLDTKTTPQPAKRRLQC